MIFVTCNQIIFLQKPSIHHVYKSLTVLIYHYHSFARRDLDPCYNIFIFLICEFSFEKLPLDRELFKIEKFSLPLYYIVSLYSLIFAVDSFIQDLIRLFSKYCRTSSNNEKQLICKFFLNNSCQFTYLWNDCLLIYSSMKCISPCLNKLISIRFTKHSTTDVKVGHAHWYT